MKCISDYNRFKHNLKVDFELPCCPCAKMNVSVIDCDVDFEEFDVSCAVLASFDNTRVAENQVEFTVRVDIDQLNYETYVASVVRKQFRDCPFVLPEQEIMVTVPCFPIKEMVNSPLVESENKEKINKSQTFPRKRLIPAEKREGVHDCASVTLSRWEGVHDCASVTLSRCLTLCNHRSCNPSVYIPVHGVPNTPEGKFSYPRFCLEMLDSIPPRVKAAEERRKAAEMGPVM